MFIRVMEFPLCSPACGWISVLLVPPNVHQGDGTPNVHQGDGISAVL